MTLKGLIKNIKESKIMATKTTENTAIVKSIFGTLATESINYFKPPYNVRNNCQVGQWAKSEDDFIGNSIEIAIIDTQEYYGKLGKSTSNWLQIFFIAAPSETKLPKNVVCVTYLKTRSLSSFGQKIIELLSSTNPAEGIFTGSFQKHTNDLGNYYSVKFDWRERVEEEKPQLKMIADFLRTLGSPLEDNGLPPTMIKVIEGNFDEAKAQFAAITSGF